MFGLHPWDVDRLTYAEIDAYLVALKRHRDDMKKAAAKRGR